MLGATREKYNMNKNKLFTAIVVSHQLSAVTSYATDMLLLDKDSRLVLAGRRDEVLASPVFLDRYGFALQAGDAA